MRIGLGLLWVLAGCAGGGEKTPTTKDSGDGQETTAEEGWCAVQALLSEKCMACHGSAALGGLDLSSDPYAALVGQTSATDAGWVLVVPGDVAASLLYQKAAGTQEAGLGTEMPPGSGVDAAGLAVLRTWIEGGASSDCSDTTTGSGGTYHPEGFGDPAVHGQEAKYQDQVCVDCHGTDLLGQGDAIPSCDTCHEEGWRTNCTFCHGDPVDGTGSPPVHISGVDDGAEASFIPHLVHVEETALKVALDCTQCHTKPTDVLSVGHLFLGDDTPGEADVVFTGGLSAAGRWDGLSCSNLYCHGNGQGNNGTVAHTASVTTCHDCHADHTSGEAAWDRMSGQHEDHLKEGIRCSECHGATVSAGMSIVDTALHVNGTPDIQLAAGMSRTSGRCTGTCHAEVHSGRAW